MTAITFDTHSFVKKLTAVGMPEKQAEVLAEEQIHLLEGRLVTQQDLKVELAKLKAELKAEIAKQKADVVKWVVSVAGVQVAFMALLKLFH